MPPTRSPIPTASPSASAAERASTRRRTTSPRFVQDKWRLNNRLTLSLGVRYDLEIIPIPETDDPLRSRRLPVDKNNIQPRVGFAYDLGGRGRSVDPRRLRPVLRQDALRADRRPLTGTPFTNSFTRTFPLTGADPGPAAGTVADRSDPRQRADAESRAARHAVPAGHAAAQHRRQLGQPGSLKCRSTDQSRSATSTSSGRGISVSADYVHACSRDMLMSLQLNPRLRATTAVTSPNIRQSSAILIRPPRSCSEKYGRASRRSPPA